MTLQFPNVSRSFDAVRNAIRFTGYDGMFEVSFFVETEALTKARRTQWSEADALSAFDAARQAIQQVAREAYSHGRRTSYTLNANDFR